MKRIIDIPEELYSKIAIDNCSLNEVRNLLDIVAESTPFDSVIEDIKAEIENAITLHIGMVGYVEAEKVIEILDNIGKAESEE